MSLPWALTRLRRSTAVRLEHGDRDRGTASAKGVGANTSLGPGISATARSPNAAAWSAAGRPHADRPGGAKIPSSKHSTPRQKARAASRPGSRPRPLAIHNLRPRVVTQLTLFSPPLCDRPGCHEPPVNSPRNPARFCGHTCRAALRNVHDRERKWRSRGTLDGRKKRAIEYQAARRRRASRRSDAPSETPPRPPPR